MKHRILPSVAAALVLAGALPAPAQMDVFANKPVIGSNPPTSLRIDFPWEAMYRDNARYVNFVPSPGGGGACVLLDLPAPVATNQGGKVETEFFKAVPGASYRAQIESNADGLSAKLFAEVWAVNPKPTDPPTKYEVPAQAGRPALINVYRAPLPDPEPGNGVWRTSVREFKVPARVRVLGRDAEPAFITLKAVGYGAGAGKIYFRGFQLLDKGPAR